MKFLRHGWLLGPSVLTALVMTAALQAGRPATADEKPKETKVTTQAPASAAGQFESGQKVAIDPVTKKLRQPTHEESAELDKGAKAAVPVESIKTVQLPNGAVMAEVPESMMDTAVVQIGPDGSLQMSCVQGTATADAVVKAGPQAPKSTPPPATDKKAPAPLEEK